MRHIKLLLGVSLFLVLSSNGYTQSIQDGSVYFYLRGNMQGSVFADIDTIEITRSENDTLDFISLGKKYSKRGDRIFSVDGLKSILLFDYKLNSGDTFWLNLGGVTIFDSLLVDSVKSITLKDGKQYNHWYLTSLSDRFIGDYLIWIEGLGSNHSWNYIGMYYVDSGEPGLKAVCDLNENIIYWDSTWNGFEPNDQPEASCDFYELEKLLSVDENTNGINRFKISPNPAGNVLFVNPENNFIYIMYNRLGQKVLTGEGRDYIDLMTLKPGHYFVRISVGNEWVSYPFIKN